MLLNADINGTASILKKVVPNAFANINSGGVPATCSQCTLVYTRKLVNYNLRILVMRGPFTYFEDAL